MVSYRAAWLIAGDRGGGRAEGFACAEGGRRRDQPVAGRAPAALPADADADLHREELDHRLPDSRRTAQDLRRQVTSRAAASPARTSWARFSKLPTKISFTEKLRTSSCEKVTIAAWLS